MGTATMSSYTISRRPESLVLAQGGPLWIFCLDTHPRVVETLRRLATTEVSGADLPALWNQVSPGTETTVDEEGWVTFSRTAGEDQVSFTLAWSSLRPCVQEMLRVYEEARPEPTPAEQQTELEEMRARYPVGSHVRHYKGGEYQVLYHALDSDGRVDMVYIRVGEPDQVYTRLASQWGDLISWEGQETRRFVPLEC